MVVTKKHHELYGELGSIVGSKYVSDDDFVLLSYTRDMTDLPPAKPQGVVVRPGSVEEVVDLVNLANQTRTPLIPTGGKASLGGAPRGHPGRGIILDMRRMDKVIEIDGVNMAVTAQGGIQEGELAAKVNEKGFDVHTAFMPHYVNTLAGHISGVSGGGFGEYGFSIGYHNAYILGMKVVLPSGSVIDTGTGEGTISSYRGHTWVRGLVGPDVTGMFIGDGGMFGIKVEATVRMFRLPKFRKAGCRCWDTLDEAYQALYDLWEIDPILYMQPYASALLFSPETMSFATMGAAEPSWSLFFSVIANSEEEVKLKFRTTDAVCAKYGGRIAEPAALTFASTYKTLMRNIGQAGSKGHYTSLELTNSRRDNLEAWKWSRDFFHRGIKKRGLDESKFADLGSILPGGGGLGMSSVIITFDQTDREITAKIEDLRKEFLEEATSRGYLLAGSHSLLARLTAKWWTPEYYNYILTLKKTLDPNNIMNPGVFSL